METAEKEKYMRRCLQLAQMGAGNVAPNPMVGCVIVYKGEIIGEGYHQKYGGPHAEVNAINSVKRQDLLPESEIFVSLEPCAHYGKTPPCADLIINKGIKKVYIGCTDSFSKVDGKGINKLRAAGIQVEVGIFENQCRYINRRFFTFVEKKRPYVILKWAQTADGFIDPLRNTNQPKQSIRISSPQTEVLTHKWRSQEAAIMVGTNTTENDNPTLDTRLWNNNNPVRIILDRNLRLDPNLKVFDGKIKTVILTAAYPGQNEPLEASENTIFVNIDFSENTAQNILNALYNLNLQSVLIEGGAKLHQSFINEDLWDEARIFLSPKMFYQGTPAAKIPTKDNNKCTIYEG